VAATVETVTGPIGPDALGVTLPHEHVYINMTRTTPQDGYLNVAEEMRAELELFTAIGGSTIIDMTNGELSDYAAPVGYSDDLRVMQQNPDTGSRSIANVLATKEMAEQTGVNVILGTGHYYHTYLNKEWFDRNSTNKIADFLIADLLDEIPGTGVRAGIIGEVASDLSRWCPRTRRRSPPVWRSSRS
jgi:predicted metal-dependent phosphotriesterase family hydrolase